MIYRKGRVSRISNSNVWPVVLGVGCGQEMAGAPQYSEHSLMGCRPAQVFPPHANTQCHHLMDSGGLWPKAGLSPGVRSPAAPSYLRLQGSKLILD